METAPGGAVTSHRPATVGLILLALAVAARLPIFVSEDVINEVSEDD